MKYSKTSSWWIVMAFVLALGTGSGCKSDDEVEPGEDGGSANAGSGGRDEDAGGGESGSGGNLPDGAIPSDGGVIINDAFVPFNPDGGDVNPPGAPCEGQHGSFEGKPTKTAEFLNQCTSSQCEPFDNVARLPLYEKGKALPPVP